jgi:hypothetical protein
MCTAGANVEISRTYRRYVRRVAENGQPQRGVLWAKEAFPPRRNKPVSPL